MYNPLSPSHRTLQSTAAHTLSHTRNETQSSTSATAHLSWREVAAATALLLWLAAQSLHFAWVKSSTYDESEHVVAGYRALTVGDFDVDHQHPPLARIWCALPLVCLNGIRQPTVLPEGLHTRPLFWGPIFMWKANRDGAYLTWLTRLPMVALTLIMAALVYGWARELYGPRSGLLALFLCAFSPNVIAHGSLATTDLPAACFSILTGWALSRWMQRPSALRGIGAGAAMGLALASKISTLSLLPALAALAAMCWLREAAAQREPSRGWSVLGRAIATVAAGVVAATVLPAAAAAALAAGVWLGWLGDRWDSAGRRAALRSFAFGAPVAALGLVAAIALLRAGRWALLTLPVRTPDFTWPEFLHIAAVGFVTCWLMLRLTSIKRLPWDSAWSSLGRWTLRTALVLLVAFGVLWASYGFGLRARAPGDRVPWRHMTGLPGSLPHVAAAALYHARHVPLPLREYCSGIELVSQLHTGAGHGCQLLVGSEAARRWLYFPMVVATKTPEGLLALLLVSVALALRHRPRWAEAALIAPPLVYLAIVLRSHMTVGVRHLLPLYAFGFVWVSRLVGRGEPRRWLGIAVAALVVCQAASVLRASPHHLAYFNTFAGGPAHGADWFRDTNVDWGQDLRLLARWHARCPELKRLGLAYFGTADPGAYGVRAPRIDLSRPWPGHVAASVTLLNESDPKQAWLHARPIVARIGGSIRVYGLAVR